jgi:prepilin-type N-terminal cleavage/methylation domain-containing protein
MMIRRRGFTLIELIVVLTLIGILVGLALPEFRNSIKRTKETVLKEDLFTIRKLINQYYLDKGKYPLTLQALVEEGYLWQIPLDPLTKSATTWVEMAAAQPRVHAGQLGVIRLGLRPKPSTALFTTRGDDQRPSCWTVPATVRPAATYDHVMLSSHSPSASWSPCRSGNQLRREKGGSVFRGNQYVEAERRIQLKNPGRFPATLEELEEERFIRKLFRDPMSPTGEWNVVLVMGGFARGGSGGAQGPGQRPGGGPGGSFGQTRGASQAPIVQRVLVAPESALESVQNALILGVVSSSTRRSIRIYNDQESYDKWLFFYGLDPKKPPEIVYWGKSEDEDDRP